jgi:hypothetical protein
MRACGRLLQGHTSSLGRLLKVMKQLSDEKCLPATILEVSAAGALANQPNWRLPGRLA